MTSLCRISENGDGASGLSLVSVPNVTRKASKGSPKCDDSKTSSFPVSKTSSRFTARPGAELIIPPVPAAAGRDMKGAEGQKSDPVERKSLSLAESTREAAGVGAA